jgi:hypothetical protein
MTWWMSPGMYRRCVSFWINRRINVWSEYTTYRCRILIWARFLQQRSNAAKENVNYFCHFKVEISNFRSLFKPTTSLHFLLCRTILSNKRENKLSSYICITGRGKTSLEWFIYIVKPGTSLVERGLFLEIFNVHFKSTWENELFKDIDICLVARDTSPPWL